MADKQILKILDVLIHTNNNMSDHVCITLSGSSFSSSSLELEFWSIAKLLHVSSAPSHLQSSVHARLCALQEHCPLHLEVTQERLTSSTTASGAAETLEIIGE